MSIRSKNADLGTLEMTGLFFIIIRRICVILLLFVLFRLEYYFLMVEVKEVKRGSLFIGVMHQSFPPAPSPPPRADPQALAIFFCLGWQITGGWGLLSCQILRGGDEKRGQMPRPSSTLQHFSLTTQSSSAILSFLMCDFLFELTSVF